MVRSRSILSPWIAFAACTTVTLSACSTGRDAGRLADAGNTSVAAPTSPGSTELQNSAPAPSYTTALPAPLPSDIPAVELRADQPGTYTVVHGDTLWDISGRFLQDPWQWPQVWENNPEIENPHLIYPGDQIRLAYGLDGQPRLEVTRQAGRDDSSSSNAFSPSSGNVVRLSPRVRVQSLQDAIPSIPGDAIAQFLAYPRVVTASQLSASPYVVGNADGRLQSASGHRIYARGDLPQPVYGIFRRSKALQDPISGELLGYEISHVADAKVMQRGDPTTLVITDNKMETISGDRLLQRTATSGPARYVPRAPQLEGEGRIVSLVDAISQSGRNQIVVLNLGERSGIQVGDVLAVESRGGRLKDRFSRKGTEVINLPNIRTGVVMVFQTFDKVSYALVMESTRPIHKNDVVTDI